jgi:cytochrome c oxidase subunit 1
MMLALAFSFVMLGFGGAGGIINMSYQLNGTIHNTQWVTGHFHSFSVARSSSCTS